MSRLIILVDLYWTRDKDPRVPLGHASILTCLRQLEGVDVESIVAAVNVERQDPARIAARILDAARGRRPDSVDVALGAYVWGEALIQGVLARLRLAGFMGRIILGGPQISYSGAGLESLYPFADAFVRGYGEEALCDLAQTHEPATIRGVHWAGTVDEEETAAVDLEALPSPWLSGAIPLDGQRFVRWETQRGCPYRCAFCQHREAGRRLRRRNLERERIAEEIELFCSSGVEDIAVLDPIFNAVKGHAVGVLEQFANEGYAGRLSLQCRAESSRESFLDVAAELDVRLEFGLQTIHDAEGRAIKRRNDVDKVDATLRAVRERSIDHEVSLIYGLPRQTLETFERSVAWCLERRVPVIKAFPLMLLRGTPLEQRRQEWGLRDSGGEMPTVVSSDTFSEGDWVEMSRLSEALKETEGEHPTSVRELRAIADLLDPDPTRWRPEEG